MGCITSSNKLNELNENVLRVRVVRLFPESPQIRTGYLELTPRELIFIAPGREPVIWALQHLRRYGLSGEVFSFEAGRRCMSGPGIYTFRCQQAECLYPLFQRYINAVNTEAFVLADRDRVSTAAGLGRIDVNPHSNNYLEPTPLTGGGSAITMRTPYNEPIGGIPLTRDIESPDSISNLSISADIMHFQATQQNQVQSPVTTPNSIANTNVYFDQPMRALQEYNNNRTITTEGTTSITSNSSTASTMTRQSLLKRCSLDLPPLECAPILCSNNSESMHMYANVDTPGANSLRERLLFDTANIERCYENINRLELPLLQTPPHRESIKQQIQQQQQTPATPTSVTGSVGVMNYTVLDFDQPRSPAQCSSNTVDGFGSGLSLTDYTSASITTITATSTPTTVETPSLTVTTKAPSTSVITSSQTKLSEPTKSSESSLGYSTIDFIKTCALIKSSTHGADFDTDEHDMEESRITRHSKCVRKAYSISE